jgi:UDP-GlcNAc:undecaprenyl-phosphate GlcNAc-1-phosphate transferase
MDLLLAFAVAMSITMALIPLLQRLAGRLQVLDLPNPRKVHSSPIPRVGGIAMAAGALLPLVIWLGHDPLLTSYLAAAGLLVAVGVWDDRRELGYRPKLAAQIVAALIVVHCGGVIIHSVTMTDRIELAVPVAMTLTVLFVVGVTNAINLSDGLDGLAGGTTLLSCCAIASLALTADAPFVATVAIILAGSILGFLRYNTYPARIFMGDGGSQFLGFTVAILAILLTQRSPAPISAALPILLFGLPILDTLTVMVQRIAEGRSLFAADKNHIHHKLLARGFDHHEAVVVVYGLQATLSVLAWFMRYESDVSILVLFGLFACAVLGSLLLAERAHWRWRATATGAVSPSPLAQRWSWLREPRRLPRWTLIAAGFGIAIYCTAVVLRCSDVPRDVAALTAGVLAAITFAQKMRLPRVVAAWIEQAALYVGAVVVVFLDLRYPAISKVPPHIETALVGVLAALVAFSFRVTPVRRFRLTSLDLIVIFVALALPNLPGSVAAPRALGLSALILLVLFYATEMLFNHSVVSRRWLVRGASVLLLTLAARGWL